ncbi:phosphotriesterase-related protein [Erysipelothrix sp. HDW6C]|uniref:phosphotriesterase family protein n=1 Tax=Erysipelothrix sp. HDW6C TaxID=2714930 RepID=UPI001408DF32|nr:phosphotriesterase-related protein [Erysipelothrix sp. HDW6C]QIK70405.1 phosphotriesterase-related protein [Erysipelothrix sp. HDW6C]
MALLKEGLTLIHEHTTIDLSKVKNNPDCFLDCFDETVQEYRDLYDLGVRNIVDVTAMGMGRNVDYVNSVADLTGINIVQATGFYKEPFLPAFVYEQSIEELAQHMVNEIRNGIDGTDTKAQVIGEIGTSVDVMEPMERKVFEAAVLAAKETGAIISTHTSLGTLALEQAAFFVEHGIDPRKVIIGHQDLSGNLDQIRTLIDMGFNVAFDTIGKNNYFPDRERAVYLKQLQDEGKLDHITLALDITRKSNFKYQGGIGYSYLFTDFLPMLREEGITEASIQMMINDNPQRIFGGEIR